MPELPRVSGAEAVKAFQRALRHLAASALVHDQSGGRTDRHGDRPDCQLAPIATQAAGHISDNSIPIFMVIVALQTVVLMLMAAMAYEDGKSRQAEALVGMAKLQKEPASAQ